MPAARADWQVLPIIEITVLVIGALLPLVLKDYLTIYATRVLILCLFALSFDLVWGYAGIMSFGQAVFFGTAGYGVALIARDLGVTSILLVLPAGALDRAAHSHCCSAASFCSAVIPPA